MPPWFTKLRQWLTPDRSDRAGTPLEYWKEWSDEDSFYQSNLRPQEHRVLRKRGTERPGSSVYNRFYPSSGVFCCRACGKPLYRATDKFDSGTGWPSFGSAIQVNRKEDFSYGGRRTEVLCPQCHSHLGHVFVERRQKQGKTFEERHCINGVCLRYVQE